MVFDFARLKKIKDSDIPDMLSIINTVFPYTSFSNEIIYKKIRDKNFFLIKFCHNNVFTGFAETQFFPDEKKARFNAVFVSEAWRGQGIATKLLKKSIHEVKRRKGFQEFFLLVKESNNSAKKLYSKCGFSFKKINEKKIEDSVVEVWSIKIR